MLRDDELAEEMNQNGFNTCDKEILSIRQKNKVRFACRGANLPSKRPREESESDEEEVVPPPLSKLVQDRHLTLTDHDTEASNVLREITPSIRKLLLDKVRPGVRKARDSHKATQTVQPLLDDLMAGDVKATVLYISNHILVPDSIFGCWLIPVYFHWERERFENEDESSDDEEHENFVDDLNMKTGQALYVTKQVPIHIRVTAILLTR